MSEFKGQLKTVQAVREFLTAGNATVTLRSIKTDTRFTYKITQCDNKPDLFFIALMSGPDNENSFRYLGTLRDPLRYAHGRKSKVSPEHASNKAFAWFVSKVAADTLPDQIEVWHEGRCGRCNRKLTVPESVERGFGPECASKVVPICEAA
jgi:hypothetical protein